MNRKADGSVAPPCTPAYGVEQFFDRAVAASLQLPDLARWTSSDRHPAAAPHLLRAAHAVHEASEGLAEEVAPR